jgi:hypothetical protein
MRKILNYLLGEDAINEQSDRDIREALIGTAICIAFALATLGAICIFG